MKLAVLQPVTHECYILRSIQALQGTSPSVSGGWLVTRTCIHPLLTQHTCLLAYLPTPSLTHSLPPSLPHSPTHSLTHPILPQPKRAILPHMHVLPQRDKWQEQLQISRIADVTEDAS